MDIYNTPILTAREVARHLAMPETTLDRWIRTQAADAPLVHALKPARRSWPRMPFVAVIEAYVLRALRDEGFSLAAITEAAAFVRREFKDPYALASRRIASDGVGLFVEVWEHGFVHTATQQVAIKEVLQEHLRFITWADDGTPAYLRLRQYGAGAEVIIDPRFSWGAPVLQASKTPVQALVSLWQAGESMDDIAYEYELARPVVEDVLRNATRHAS